MPPFPERESSILAKLKKKKGPSTVTDLEETKRERSADVNGGPEPAPASTSAAVGPCLLCLTPRAPQPEVRSQSVSLSGRSWSAWTESPAVALGPGSMCFLPGSQGARRRRRACETGFLVGGQLLLPSR